MISARGMFLLIC
uniref:Ring finger protein, putative n=1 Tax=Arundo donax TaxID=35708 RepID=A0A0A9E228_ARUDO